VLPTAGGDCRPVAGFRRRRGVRRKRSVGGVYPQDALCLRLKGVYWNRGDSRSNPPGYLLSAGSPYVGLRNPNASATLIIIPIAMRGTMMMGIKCSNSSSPKDSLSTFSTSLMNQGRIVTR
jgi:hypothetical protein